MSLYKLHSLSTQQDRKPVRDAITSLVNRNEDINYQVYLLLEEPTDEIKQDLNSIVIEGEYGAIAPMIHNLIQENSNLSLDLTNTNNCHIIRHTLISQVGE